MADLASSRTPRSPLLGRSFVSSSYIYCQISCNRIANLQGGSLLSLSYQALRSQFGSCTNGPRTFDPVCSSGCPTTILRNLSRPSRLCSITSSLNRFVKTFPGRGGIVTCRCVSAVLTVAVGHYRRVMESENWATRAETYSGAFPFEYIAEVFEI